MTYNIFAVGNTIQSQALEFLLACYNQQICFVHMHTFEQLIEQSQTQQSNLILNLLPNDQCVKVAEFANGKNINYMDANNSTAGSQLIKSMFSNSSNTYLLQMGYVPGWTHIIANYIADSYAKIKDMNIYFGHLPLFGQSTDWIDFDHDSLMTLIESDSVLLNATVQTMMPLENAHLINVNGFEYEAFSCSNSMGNLIENFAHKSQNINCYQLALAGHRQFLNHVLHGLNLNNQAELLQVVLQKTLPLNNLTKCVFLVRCVGIKQNQQLESSFYSINVSSRLVNNVWFDAKTITKLHALGSCIELLAANKLPKKSLIDHKDIGWNDWTSTQCGKLFSLV